MTEDPAASATRMQVPLAPLWLLLRRLRRRLRAQRAVEGLVQGGLAGLLLTLMSLCLYRLALISPRQLFLLTAAALVLVIAAALRQVLHRIPLMEVAGRIDRSHDLKNRLGSAVEFSARIEGEEVSAAFRRLALWDAARVLEKVELHRAAPWRRPRHLLAVGVLVLLNILVGVLRVPPRQPRAAGAPPPRAEALRMNVEPELIAPEREEATRLLAEARREGDDDLEETLREIQKLLDQIERGELTRQQAFDRIAELEQRLMRGKEGALEELREKLRKAGAELGKDKLGREVGRALMQEDLDRAKQELKRLAEQALARAGKKGEQDKQALAEAMRRAAEPERQKDEWEQKTEAEKRSAREQELREEERRLRKQLAQHPQDEESARRLKQVQRELERLERERQERAEAQRELERLRRDMEEAARELERQLDKMTPEQRKAIEQLVKDLDRMQDEMRKLKKPQGQGQAPVMVMLGSIKQVLRRVARSASGPGGQIGRGQGKDHKGKSPMKDFLDRAKGKGGEGETLEEGEGQGGQKMLVLGEGNTPVLMPGLPQGGGKQGEGGERPGPSGIGTSHDPNHQGEATQIDARRRLTKVTGKEGAGPTRSETILGSAERGFATEPYRKVYDDYMRVSEEVMSKERVPPGYRFYVKRYFQLIKPRE